MVDNDVIECESDAVIDIYSVISDGSYGDLGTDTDAGVFEFMASMMSFWR